MCSVPWQVLTDPSKSQYTFPHCTSVQRRKWFKQHPEHGLESQVNKFSNPYTSPCPYTHTHLPYIFFFHRGVRCRFGSNARHVRPGKVKTACTHWPAMVLDIYCQGRGWDDATSRQKMIYVSQLKQSTWSLATPAFAALWACSRQENTAYACFQL